MQEGAFYDRKPNYPLRWLRSQVTKLHVHLGFVIKSPALVGCHMSPLKSTQRKSEGHATPTLTIYSGEYFRFTELHRMSTIVRLGTPVRGDPFVPLLRRIGNMPVVVQFVNGDVKTYPVVSEKWIGL